MSVRLTKAAWLLLQRLNQESAELAVCGDRRCGRTHFWLRGQVSDVVRESTLRVLHQAGFLHGMQSKATTCRISDKGRQMLRERLTDAEFLEEVR